jgi:hypothetical protein
LEAELEANKEGGIEGALKNLALADGMCDFLFSDDLLFGKNLHGVYAPGVLFANLEDLAEGAYTNKLQELEIAWGQGTPGLDGAERNEVMR